MAAKPGQAGTITTPAAPHPRPVTAKIIETWTRKAKGITPEPLTPDAIMSRIRARMGQEAEAVLAEGIAQSAEDIDVVMTHGYGYPRWQGSILPQASPTRQTA